MFSGCNKLVYVPTGLLPNTRLNNACYHKMFNACTGLKTHPVLPATTLAPSCYYDMFGGNWGMREINLPGSSLQNYCYLNLLAWTSNVSAITVHFTEWTGTNSTQDWVSHVASTGEFHCPAGLDTSTSGTSRVPSNWTIIKDVVD